MKDVKELHTLFKDCDSYLDVR